MWRSQKEEHLKNRKLKKIKWEYLSLGTSTPKMFHIVLKDKKTKTFTIFRKMEISFIMSSHKDLKEVQSLTRCSWTQLCFYYVILVFPTAVYHSFIHIKVLFIIAYTEDILISIFQSGNKIREVKFLIWINVGEANIRGPSNS